MPVETAPTPEVIDPNLEARNAWLDSMIDDNQARPLPHITLEKQHKERINVEIEGYSTSDPQVGDPKIETSIYSINSEDGEAVGQVILNKPQEGDYYIGNIEIDQRNQGYGPATYLAILKSLPEGTGLRTEGVLSRGAKHSWRRLVRQGVAEKITDDNGEVTGFRTIPMTEAVISRKKSLEVVSPSAEDNARLEPKLSRALQVQGFFPIDINTRRGVTKELVDDDDAIEMGYTDGHRPTWEEINNKLYGKDNWGLVPNGQSADLIDVSDRESPELTAFLNQEVTVFVRPKGGLSGDQEPETFAEVTGRIRSQDALASLALRPRE